MEEEIELALAPYREMAPPQLLATMRENLEAALRSHPVPRELIRVMAKPKAVDTSGEVPRGDGAAQDPTTGEKPGA
jgi:hypothetical protein